MTDTVFMTGATGFLGTELASRMIRSIGGKIYVLVRASGEEEAIHRLREAWQHDRDLAAEVGRRILPVAGDFTEPGLGLAPSVRKQLRETVTLVIHAGAETGFQKSREELMRTNVGGTKRVLAFAALMKNLRRFVHISTAYVAGQKSGTVREEDPPASAFSGFYEKSKAMAETLVRESMLPYSICRPGMLVGNSRTGWIRNFNTVYYVLKLILKEELKVLPVAPDTPLNIVPGDAAAEAVFTICCAEEAAGKTFHLTCPEEAAPRAGELMEAVGLWAEENLSLSLPRMKFVPLPFLKQAGLLYNKKEDNRTRSVPTNLLTLMPYFFGEQRFDRTNTDRICGQFDADWHGYLDRLLDFACRKNFMRQTGRTVFEQAMERR